jgi:hypothetical protein
MTYVQVVQKRQLTITPQMRGKKAKFLFLHGLHDFSTGFSTEFSTATETDSRPPRARELNLDARSLITGDLRSEDGLKAGYSKPG